MVPQKPAARWTFCSILLLALSALVLVPIGGTDRATSAAFDLAHAPLFGLASLVVAWCLRSHLSAWLAALSSLVCITVGGALLEAAQQYVGGRQASLRDVHANALGSLGFLVCFALPIRSTTHRIACLFAGIAALAWVSLRPILILVDVAQQQRSFPMLASFESRLELDRWETRECRAVRDREQATDGEWSWRIDLDRGLYPGVALRYPVTDWSGYSQLQFDVLVKGDASVPIVVKIEDALHNHEPSDRFERAIQPVSSRWQRIVIPLSEVARTPAGRTMDLTRIGFLQFFTVQPTERHTIYIDRVLLE